MKRVVRMWPRLPDPAEPVGWRPMSWGFPAGWDVPVYSADLVGWLLPDSERHFRRRWPAVPDGLSTAEDLAARGLRPRQALCPDGLIVGPAHVDGRPVSVNWKLINRHVDDLDPQIAE